MKSLCLITKQLLLSLMIMLYACSSPNEQNVDNHGELGQNQEDELDQNQVSNLDTNQAGDLDQNRAKWSALSLQSYQYNFRRSCCGSEDKREVIILYTNGQKSVMYADDLTTPQDTIYPSIEELFDIIQDAIDKEETRLIVEYHPQFGYPTLISRDPIPAAIDDDISYWVDHFKTNNTLYTSTMLVSDLDLITDGAEFVISDAMIELAGSAGHDFDALNLTIGTTSSCSAAYFRFYILTTLTKLTPPQAQTKVIRLPIEDEVCDQPLTYQAVVDLTPFKQEIIKTGISDVILLIGSFSLRYQFDPGQILE